MCERCGVAFDKAFKGIDKDTADFILWNMTAFPFADLKYFRRQVSRLARVVRPRKPGWRKRLSQEMRRQDEEMDRELRGASNGGTGVTVATESTPIPSGVSVDPATHD